MADDENLEKVAFKLLSVELGIVVGSKEANIKSMANTFIEYFPEFSEPLIKSLHIHKFYDELMKTSEGFNNKIEKLNLCSHSLEQEKKYNPVLSELFPYLFEPTPNLYLF